MTSLSVVKLVLLVCVVVVLQAAQAQANNKTSCNDKKKKKVRCDDKKKHPHCSSKQFNCPTRCPNSCSVNCTTCRPVCDCDKPGAVCDDPRMVGADGIPFYFNGRKNRNFCLVTDTNLHINGYFIGKTNYNMKRDFTWVQSLGILFGGHKLYLGAKKTTTWNSCVDRLKFSFDNESINITQKNGTVWKSTSGSLTITRLETVNVVEMEVEKIFKIKAKAIPITQKESFFHNYGINENDCFAHLDLTFKFFSLTSEVNGVLGQTYSPTYVSKFNVTDPIPVLGGDQHYNSSGIFKPDCSVSKFTAKG